MAEEPRGLQRAGAIGAWAARLSPASLSKKRTAIPGWTSPPDAFPHSRLGGCVSVLTEACGGWQLFGALYNMIRFAWVFHHPPAVELQLLLYSSPVCLQPRASVRTVLRVGAPRHRRVPCFSRRLQWSCGVNTYCPLIIEKHSGGRQNHSSLLN